MATGKHGWAVVWVGMALAIAAGAPRGAAAVTWEPIGLSGGGGMFAPAISPVNGDCMMINCDMGAAYVTEDGGRHWRMIHYSQLRTSTRCRPAFHPKEARTIFAASGWSGLRVSRDLGVRWEAIGNLPGDLRGEIAIDPGAPDRMMAGTAKEVWRSGDGGRSWAKCAGPRGATVSFHFDQASDAAKRTIFAATTEGVWRSDDGGATWAEKSAGLPWRGLRSFAGSSDATTKRVALYCAIPSKNENGAYRGGVYRSVDRGESWGPVEGEGMNRDVRAADRWAMGDVAQYYHVLTTNRDANVVYALNGNTGVQPPHHTAVYRSEDGGRTWRATFYPDPRFGASNVEADYVVAGARQFFQDVALGAAINPADPNQVMQVDSGRCYITRDGGKGWMAGHTLRAEEAGAAGPASRWLCNGLVVTTTWNYFIDPFEAGRHYICYTDIGFARSLDGAKSWMWWDARTRAPWANTCYELAFEPTDAGKMWGAFSEVHDIPNGNIISGRHRSNMGGGVCVSTDFGASWTLANRGLPNAPAVSVVVDPKTPAGGRTMYVSMFGHGVYKSTDSGRRWHKASDGIGSAENLRVCRLQLGEDGSVYVLVTALRKGGQYVAEGPGLYRSTNGGRSWERVNRSLPLLWPKDFTVAGGTIYLGAADAGGAKQGGLYATKDGGATWKLLARKGPEHFGAYVHPRRGGWVYMTLTEDAPGAGLWLSKDGGETWKAMEGLPFANAQRVTFDPKEDGVIYVTTFGGSVWRGPAEE